MTHEELLARIDEQIEIIDTERARSESPSNDTFLNMQYRLLNSLFAVVEFHCPVPNYKNNLVCAYCETLCHSNSGLGCDPDGDGLWPCETIRAIEKELG